MVHNVLLRPILYSNDFKDIVQLRQTDRPTYVQTDTHTLKCQILIL